MNIDELPIKDELPSEQIEYLQKKQNEYKHIGTVRKNPGHILFSFNRKTKEIKPAKFEYKCALGLDGKVHTEAQVTVEPDCFYEQALNKANLIKRLKRYGYLD